MLFSWSKDILVFYVHNLMDIHLSSNKYDLTTEGGFHFPFGYGICWLNYVIWNQPAVNF